MVCIWWSVRGQISGRTLPQVCAAHSPAMYMQSNSGLFRPGEHGQAIAHGSHAATRFWLIYAGAQGRRLFSTAHARMRQRHGSARPAWPNTVGTHQVYIPTYGHYPTTGHHRTAQIKHLAPGWTTCLRTAYAPPTHRLSMLGGKCGHLDNWPRYVHGNRLVHVWPMIEPWQATTGRVPWHLATWICISAPVHV